jgi:hypothetical protein
MKKIRTAGGGLMFLEGEDYMPKLLAYLRETAGPDAADLVEEWAQEQKDLYLDAVVKAENDAFEARNRANRMFEEMRDERDEHIEEIAELEGELTALAEFRDKLLDANEYMLGLIRNPEKLFPAIGTGVYRDTKGGKHDEGSILAYKLRVDTRTKHPEFFVQISWRYAGISWSKFKNVGKTFHIPFGEDVRV